MKNLEAESLSDSKKTDIVQSTGRANWKLFRRNFPSKAFKSQKRKITRRVCSPR